MILQLGGLGDLIIAITTAAAGNSVNVENEKGKLDFLYQWRYSEVSVTAWRNLRKERYKHYSSLPEHKISLSFTFLPGCYIARKIRLYPLRRGQCGHHSQSECAGEEKTPYSFYQSIYGLLLFHPVA